MYYTKEACILMCIGQLMLTTNALLFDRTTPKPKTVCHDNQNADAFIQGDSQNAVQNFLHAINERGVFRLMGDLTVKPEGCRRAIDSNKRRKGRFNDGVQWTMDCWEPSECTMIEGIIDGEHIFNVLPVSTSTKAAVKVQTVFLPFDSHETSSYTFLPSTSQRNFFFVTGMLTGCSFFVAKPQDTNCNLIVIHTNYRCNNKTATGTDFNHQQAMAVLAEVESTNRQCKYQIERRWAESDWRPAIESARYSYANRIYYYDLDLHPFFLYGSYVSHTSGRWQFCIKAAMPNPPAPTCYSI